MGWNCKGWGWAAEHIVGIDVITASGEMVHCSEKINDDLFWCARGSGSGFFGIATRFHLQTQPIPVGMLASTYIWSISEYDAVMRWVLETSHDGDTNVEVAAIAMYLDKSETAPPDQSISLVVLLLTFHSSVEAARVALDRFAKSVPRREAALVIDEFKATSLRDQIEQHRATAPEGHRWAVDNAWIHNHLPTEDVINAIRPIFTSLPSPQSLGLYVSMSPEPALSDMAFSLQSAHWLNTMCVWKDSTDDSRHQNWVKAQFKNIDTVSSGLYLGDADFKVRKAPFLAPERRERVEKLRNLWDPQGLFCSYLGLEDE